MRKQAQIMKKAWSIRKAAAAKWNVKVSEILMGACLVQAWAESKMSIFEGIAQVDDAVKFYADGRFWIYKIQESDIHKASEKAIILKSERGGACLPKSQLKIDEKRMELLVPDWLVRKNVILLERV